jgi:hypothetical protein
MGTHAGPAGWPADGTALPRPAGWTRPRFPLWLECSVGFLPVMALAAVAEAAWAFWTGQPADGVLLAAGAILLWHVVGLGARLWWPRRRSSRTSGLNATPDGTPGVTFSYSAWAYYWVTAVLVMTVPGVLVLAVALALSASVVGIVTAVAIGVLAMLVGWMLVTMLRLAPGRLILSPMGVYHRSLTSTHFIPWQAIVAVSAGWTGTAIIAVKASPSQDTRVRRYLGRFGSGETRFLPIMVIRTAWLATDPAIVYHALSFYLARPELRAELATPDALDRISKGRAVSPQAA